MNNLIIENKRVICLIVYMHNTNQPIALINSLTTILLYFNFWFDRHTHYTCYWTWKTTKSFRIFFLLPSLPRLVFGIRWVFQVICDFREKNQINYKIWLDFLFDYINWSIWLQENDFALFLARISWMLIFQFGNICFNWNYLLKTQFQSIFIWSFQQLNNTI